MIPFQKLETRETGEVEIVLSLSDPPCGASIFQANLDLSTNSVRKENVNKQSDSYIY